jgi:sugar phosphate permease
VVRQEQSTAAGTPGKMADFAWPILIASLLVQTTASLPHQSISPLAPFLQREAGFTREQIGWLSTAIFTGAVFAMLPSGWAADRFGVRVMYGGGLLLAGLATLAMTQLPLFSLLLAMGALLGLGNGIALPATTRAIMNWFPQRTRAVAMSIKQTGVALAGAWMAWTLPSIGSQWGWRGALLAVGLVILCSAAVACAMYRDPAEPASGSAKAAPPRFGDVFRSRPLLLASCAAALYGLVQLSLVNFMVLFLTESFRYPVVLAGLLLGWAQMAGVLARIFWGGVSDAIFGGRRRIVLSIIGLLTAGVTLGLSFLPRDAPVWLVAALVVAAGLSAIGWNGVHMTFVAEVAGRELSATAAAFSLTLTYVGIMIGPPLFGRIVDTTGAYTLALQVLTAVSLAAVGILQTVRVEHGQRAG